MSLWVFEHMISNNPQVKQAFDDKKLNKEKIKNMIDPKLEEIVS